MSSIKRFIKFYWRADTKYSIHSPFIFSLINNVIDDDRDYYCFGALERLRNTLKRDKTVLEITDLGAGSRIYKTNSRTVANIAQTSVSPKWQCEFLFRLIHYLQLENRIEIGTSLGISALYQYFPIKNAPLYTLEGCPKIAAIAAQNFKKFQAPNIHLEIGNFDQTLPLVLKKIDRLDYAFIDGNHQFRPTLSYFEECLKYSHKDTVFVFDDIHWSDEMEAAWEAIKAHPRVRLSLDLFYMGLVFLREENKEKQHFNVVPVWSKPWKWQP